MGAGFVGTDKSTMSLLAERRVKDWNTGFAVESKWNSTPAHRKREFFAVDEAEFF
jgi:hypothetical protein